MDDNEENENLFSDDLDDLPDNAWDALEQNAIQSTQHPGNPKLQEQAELEQSRNQRTEDHHLSRQLYVSNLPLPPPPQSPDASVVYGDTDFLTAIEDRRQSVPLHAWQDINRRQEFRQRRYGETGRPARVPGVLKEQYNPETGTSRAIDGQRVDFDADDSTVGGSINELHRPYSQRRESEAQMVELISQRDNLARELEDAKSKLMTQKGEIAIIRANQNKDAKEFGRQIAALKESFQDGTTRHRHDLEVTNKQSEKIANANLFLEHELKTQIEQTQALQKSLKAKEARSANSEATGPLTTPQKTRQLPLRDGFDEADITVVSPTKSPRRSKGSTPTNAGKRKRKVAEASAIPTLTLHESLPATEKGSDAAKVKSTEDTKTTVVVRKNRRVQKSLHFMQRMLNYRLAPDQDRMLEVFSQFAFPSDPKKSFTSIVLEASASLSGETLPSGFCKIIIFLWAQALKEKYYRPVLVLVSVMQYILALESSVINSEIIQKIIPVLQATTDVNGAVRFKNSPVSHQNFGQLKQTPRSEINSQVDGNETLDMLYSIACSCVYKPKLREDFWRTVNSSFVLMMLNVAQPVADLSLTLNLLSTSILPSTFGTILSNESDQQKIEHYLLDRVAYLLWEIPRVDEGCRQPTRHETYELRMEALSLLSELALSPRPPNQTSSHGSILLTTHASFIGRLVRFLYDTVDALYTPIEPPSPTHTLLSDLINRATFLLHHLLIQQSQQNHHHHQQQQQQQQPPHTAGGNKSIHLHDKLSAVNGSIQKHLVVLTRLAFSEGIHLESGITDDTVAMAHEMLEDAVTPDEAEALVQVFPGSARGAEEG